MGDMDNILYSQQAVPGGVIQPLVAEPAVDVPQDPAQQAVPGGVIEPLIAEPAVDVPQDPVQQGVIPYNIQNALLQVAGPPQAVVIPEDQPQAVVIPENLPQSVGILDRNELFTQRVVPREVFEIWIADPVLDMNQDDPEPVITPEIIDLTGDETLIGHVVSNQIGNNPIGYQNPIELVTNHPNHLSQLATHLLQYPSLTHEIINTLTIPPSGLNFESVRVLIVDLGFMELAETNQLRYGLVVSATSEYPGDVTSTAAIIQGRLPYLRLAQMTSLNPDQYGFWSALYRGGEVSYWAP
jgi:hypothetical protein